MTIGYEGDEPILVPTGDISEILRLGHELQHIASREGIHNVFDDGGYKELFMLTLFDLRKLNRDGDDAEDRDGRRYEMKTVARVSAAGIRKPTLSITTEHTLTLKNLERYRRVFKWIVGVFDQAEAEAVYEIDPSQLERYFGAWEEKILAQGTQRAGGAPIHINNPKIPLSFIERNGVLVWPW